MTYDERNDKNFSLIHRMCVWLLSSSSSSSSYFRGTYCISQFLFTGSTHNFTQCVSFCFALLLLKTSLVLSFFCCTSFFCVWVPSFLYRLCVRLFRFPFVYFHSPTPSSSSIIITQCMARRWDLLSFCFISSFLLPVVSFFTQLTCTPHAHSLLLLLL